MRRHLEGAGNAQHHRNAQDQLTCGKTTLGGGHQQHSHHRLDQHAGRKNASAVQPVGCMPCGQRHQQSGYELEEADQAQIPGAGGDVIHVPGNSDHEHLVGRNPGQASEPEPDKRALDEQLGETGIRHGLSLAAPGKTRRGHVMIGGEGGIRTHGTLRYA